MQNEMEIQYLRPEETDAFRTLTGIFREVFAHTDPPPPDTHLAALLQRPDYRVFVVRVQGQVVGGLTLHVLHSCYRTQPEAYLYDVGIHPAHQGRGLGQALMAAVCAYCRAEEFSCAYVEAETEDTAAVAFYEKTAYSSRMEATHFTYDTGMAQH